MRQVEQPKYTVLSSNENIELRDYEAIIVAEVEVFGERKDAIKEGFKRLADYIFGNNIAMSTPSINPQNEKIKMTAPVMQEGQKDQWKVRFVMPAKYSLDTLPKPNSKEVSILPVAAKRFAVIRFSGLPDNERIKLHLQKLEEFIASEKWQTIGNPIFAFYNPPWTLPFLRRNEVMLEVCK